MILKRLTLLFATSISSMMALEKPLPANPDLELVITSPRVVQSPLASYPGTLSFGGLIERNYGKELAPSIVRSLILSFSMQTKVAGQVISPRADAFEKVIQPWMTKDGFSGENLLEWTPNLANAPLKLLAVVNRQDISIASTIAPASDFHISSPPSPLLNAALTEEEKRRLGSGGGTTGYYSTQGGGEIRFVYCLTDQNGTPLTGGMTVILEFNQQNLHSSNHMKDFASFSNRFAQGIPQKISHYIAKRWHALGNHDGVNDDYLQDLDALVKDATTPIPGDDLGTKSVVEIIAASPLLRIRTNDSALGAGREFRQFDSTGKTLMPSLLSASLADAFCDPETPESKALSEFVIEKNFLPLEILVEKKMVKLSTASSLTLPEQEENTAWNLKKISTEGRRHISMNSCIGCHGKETESDGFHIAPPSNNLLPSLLSEFLSNDSIRTSTRDPHSLRRIKQPGELARRIRIHEALIQPKILNPRRWQDLTNDVKNTTH